MPPFPARGLKPYYDELQAWLYQARNADGTLKDAPAIARADSRVFDVRKYGAVGDGTTNDRAAIQATIDAAVAAGGGTVVFPEGTYKVQITTATTVTSPVSSGQHCLVIAGNNITLQGAPGAVIDCYVLNGDPDTNWEVVDLKVWRGGGVFVTGGSTYATRRRNVQIQDLEIRGNFTYTGDHSWPANTTTGGGWDTSHKGIWYQNDTYLDEVAVRRVHIWGFSGEVVYSGGGDTGATPVLGAFAVDEVYVHDTNGSAISMSGRNVTIARCRIHTCAGNGIENVANEGRHNIWGNEVSEALLAAIAAICTGEGHGGFDIHDNPVLRATAATPVAIDLVSLWHSQVHHNTCFDGGIRARIGSGYPNDDMRDVDLLDNQVFADRATFGLGVSIGSGTVYRMRIHGNTVGQTAAGIVGGFICNEPLTGPTVDWSKVDLKNNNWQGVNAQSDLSKSYNRLLTTTGITSVAVRKPSVPTMFRVDVSYEVITAATNVTVNCRIKSINNVIFQIPMQALASKAVGVYALPSIMVPMAAVNDCRVDVTAGTANQVYVYATITEA